VFYESESRLSTHSLIFHEHDHALSFHETVKNQDLLPPWTLCMFKYLAIYLCPVCFVHVLSPCRLIVLSVIPDVSFFKRKPSLFLLPVWKEGDILDIGPVVLFSSVPALCCCESLLAPSPSTIVALRTTSDFRF
jgi:hypothetical protein